MHSSPDRTGALQRRGLLPATALIALNGALLLALGAVTFGSRATAQSLARGEYTAVAGAAAGATSDVVYIFDTVNQEMVAVMWDPNANDLAGVGYRNLAADSAGAMGSGRQR